MAVPFQRPSSIPLLPRCIKTDVHEIFQHPLRTSRPFRSSQFHSISAYLSNLQLHSCRGEGMIPASHTSPCDPVISFHCSLRVRTSRNQPGNERSPPPSKALFRDQRPRIQRIQISSLPASSAPPNGSQQHFFLRFCSSSLLPCPRSRDACRDPARPSLFWPSTCVSHSSFRIPDDLLSRFQRSRTHQACCDQATIPAKSPSALSFRP